ncbi:MAG: DNA cytosine methyltransferase [Sphingopyxis sp.]|nr:DNA cytosine methyltransferase [Sphingopyxis sp.]
MKSVELFAGAGGLAMGVSQAGFKPVQIVEWDKWCCDTIQHNRANQVAIVKDWPSPTLGDVRPMDFRSLEGVVDLVTGGPPCQPFSMGGQHRAFDDQRDMWPQAVRAVREIRPKAFIFENVKGMTRAAFATYFSYIDLQLHHPAICRRRGEDWRDHFGRLQQHHTCDEKMLPEYKVVAEVLNSADYGIPQKRERVIFVGFRADMKIAWRFPRPTHSSDRLLWDKYRSGEYWDRHQVSSKYRRTLAPESARAERLDCIPSEEPWQTVRDALSKYGEPTENGSGKFLNHKLQHGARSYLGHTGSPMDQPAKTLKAGVHGVPGGENMLVRSDGSVRYFSVRESAALQTFPDQYEFRGSWTEAMRQLGNAVPVKLANSIASDVRRNLECTNA